MSIAHLFHISCLSLIRFGGEWGEFVWWLSAIGFNVLGVSDNAISRWHCLLGLPAFFYPSDYIDTFLNLSVDSQ